MQSWLSNLKSAMMSSRLGARAVRWNGWRRLNPLALSLLFAFALVVCPTTRAFAYNEYDMALTGSTGLTLSGSISPWEVSQADLYTVSSTVSEGTALLESYFTVRVGNTFSNMLSTLPEDGFLQSLISFDVTVATNFASSSPSIPDAKFVRAEVISVNSNYMVQDFQFNSSEWGTSGNRFKTRVNLGLTNHLPSGNASQYQVTYIRMKVTASVDRKNLITTYYTTKTPTITLSLGDASYRLRSAVSYNSYQGKIYDAVHSLDMAFNDNQVAADALDQANQNFVQDAAQLESHQAVLEGAADASVGAVDMNQINLIDTYSASVSFWSQLIGQLPTVLGSLWYVFIFGLLLAFVLFVLRIRR